MKNEECRMKITHPMSRVKKDSSFYILHSSFNL